MSYTIRYEYYSWLESCGCCGDSSSEIHVMNNDNKWDERVFSVPVIENEFELRELISKYFREYLDFTIHPDTQYY